MTNDLKDKIEFYQEIGWWWKVAEIIDNAYQSFSPTRLPTGIKEGLCPVCRKPFLKRDGDKYIHREYGHGAYMYHEEHGED